MRRTFTSTTPTVLSLNGHDLFPTALEFQDTNARHVSNLEHLRPSRVVRPRETSILLLVMNADHKNDTAAPLVACCLALMCQACPPG